MHTPAERSEATSRAVSARWKKSDSKSSASRDGDQIVSTVADLVQWGLRGASPPPGRALALRVGAVLAFLALWSLASGLVVLLQLFNPIFLAGPWLVLGKLLQLALNGQLWGHVAATLGRVAVGFTTGAVLALGLGLLAGQLRPVRSLVEPIVEVLRPIPPLAMLPLFIVWVGIGETSKIAFITYATFFPVFLTTVHAVQQVDPLLLRAARSLGARRAQLFLRVVLPAALPEILTGIRLGVALAFFVIVISEFIGAEQGLGYLINDGRNFFLVPQMLGAAIVLGLLGYAGNALVMLLGRRWLRWERPAAS
jgi:ABC-type nitrate/sulfonate/bicarbonate transport system permease component